MPLQSTLSQLSPTKNDNLTNITILDVGFVLLYLMIVFLVNSLWFVEPDVTSLPIIKSIGLGVIMFSIAIFSVIIYLFAATTGQMKNLKIVTPTILIAALISGIIWIGYNAFLPLSSSVSTLDAATQNINVIANFLGVEFFNFLQQVVVFAIGESLLFGILLMFFLGVVKITKGTIVLAPVFLLIVLFMSILHAAIALAFDVSGSLDFFTVIIHQIVAFAILGLFFFFFGMAGNIAAHQVKNVLALGAPLIFVFIIFIIYLFITLLAMQQAKKTNVSKMRVNQGFGV